MAAVTETITLARAMASQKPLLEATIMLIHSAMAAAAAAIIVCLEPDTRAVRAVQTVATEKLQYQGLPAQAVQVAGITAAKAAMARLPAY